MGRTGPPGNSQRRSRQTSEYGRQLIEKQKIKAYYGIYEKQLRRYYAKALRTGGKTGEVLLVNLETRLDNLVYRMGVANSNAMGRQMVSHKHIEVDGKVVNVPNYAVKPGQVISLKQASREIVPFVDNFQNAIDVLPYIETDKDQYSGRLVRMPERSELPVQIDEQMVVEFYSR